MVLKLSLVYDFKVLNFPEEFQNGLIFSRQEEESIDSVWFTMKELLCYFGGDRGETRNYGGVSNESMTLS